MIDPYILLLIGAGSLILLTAWLPMVLKEAPLSLPIFCIGIGAAGYWLIKPQIPESLLNLTVVEKATELTLIIALMGAGLKLDRKIGLISWGITWRLLLFAMPLTILAIAIAATSLLGITGASALLLAAALSPTDPVLASDVQVGPPKSGQEDETRFALTSEAGLNDGLAFPFVMCAIALAESSKSSSPWLLHWLAIDVVWKLASGATVGIVVGYALGWLVFKMPNRAKLSKTGDGFVALGITLAVYGIAEVANGYGFVAVFVSALALRAAERSHKYHVTLHDFAEQLERLLMMVLLVLFGGLLASGFLLQSLTWAVVCFALIAIFFIRPGSAWLSLVGSRCPYSERATISFFGIRGIGSIYYVAYAAHRQQFDQIGMVWSAVSIVVLMSVLLHGVTVTPTMRFIDQRRKPAG